MSQILILGGSGFIGRHLSRKLLAAGHSVTVFDRSPSPVEEVTYLQGELTSQASSWGELLNGFDVIYHLAWTTKPQSANDNPILDAESNVIAGLHFLDALVKQPVVPKLIFVSTGGAIYGPPVYVPLDETHPTNPLCAYGISKLALEHYLALYHHLHGLEYLIFRPGNPYGEEQDPAGSQGAVAVFLGRVMNGLPVNIWGTGETVRDYVYIGDLIDALFTGIEYQPRQSARVFNIGSGQGISLNQLLAELGEVSGKMPDVKYLPARKTDTLEVVLDCHLAANQLGWVPKVALREGLTRTWSWLQREMESL